MKNINNFNISEIIEQELKTEDDIKEWLSMNLEAYLEDGNLNAFVRSLEYVVRAKDNISNLSKKTGISRSNLYAIFKILYTYRCYKILAIFPCYTIHP